MGDTPTHPTVVATRASSADAVATPPADPPAASSTPAASPPKTPLPRGVRLLHGVAVALRAQEPWVTRVRADGSLGMEVWLQETSRPPPLLRAVWDAQPALLAAEPHVEGGRGVPLGVRVPVFFATDRDASAITHAVVLARRPPIVGVTWDEHGRVTAVTPARYVNHWMYSVVRRAALVVGDDDVTMVPRAVAAVANDALESRPWNRLGPAAGVHPANPEGDAARATASRDGGECELVLPLFHNTDEDTALLQCALEPRVPVGYRLTLAPCAAATVEPLPAGFQLAVCPRGASDADILSGAAPVFPFTDAHVTVRLQTHGPLFEPADVDALLAAAAGTPALPRSLLPAGAPASPSNHITQIVQDVRVHGPVLCSAAEPSTRVLRIQPRFRGVSTVYRVVCCPLTPPLGATAAGGAYTPYGLEGDGGSPASLDFCARYDTLESLHLLAGSVPVHSASPLPAVTARGLNVSSVNTGALHHAERVYQLAGGLANEGAGGGFAGGHNNDRLRDLTLELVLDASVAGRPDWGVWVISKTYTTLVYAGRQLLRSVPL